jgi:NTP pyrophosphatase (non-canonical NTP hydrolase)
MIGPQRASPKSPRALQAEIKQMAHTAADVEVTHHEPSSPKIVAVFDTNGITFEALQIANRERGKVWGAGQDIPYLFNAVELGGEAGEVLNAVKKFYRGEIGIAGGVDREKSLNDIAEELGDVVICCSLLANKLGINLGQAVADKFNKTSEKHGFPHRLAA